MIHNIDEINRLLKFIHTIEAIRGSDPSHVYKNDPTFRNEVGRLDFDRDAKRVYTLGNCASLTDQFTEVYGDEAKPFIGFVTQEELQPGLIRGAHAFTGLNDGSGAGYFDVGGRYPVQKYKHLVDSIPNNGGAALKLVSFWAPIKPTDIVRDNRHRYCYPQEIGNREPENSINREKKFMMQNLILLNRYVLESENGKNVDIESLLFWLDGMAIQELRSHLMKEREIVSDILGERKKSAISPEFKEPAIAAAPARSPVLAI